VQHLRPVAVAVPALYADPADRPACRSIATAPLVVDGTFAISALNLSQMVSQDVSFRGLEGLNHRPLHNKEALDTLLYSLVKRNWRKTIQKTWKRSGYTPKKFNTKCTEIGQYRMYGKRPIQNCIEKQSIKQSKTFSRSANTIPPKLRN
jgi:hypothetical protein